MFPALHALDRAISNSPDIWVSGRVSAEHIAQLEKGLEVKLPPSFCQFLSSFGAIAIYDVTVSGIIENNPLSMSGGSLYGDTMRFRQEHNLPKHLLVVQADEDAPYCLDFSAVNTSGETIVVCYQLHTNSAKQIAASFDEWLNLYVISAAV